MSAPAAPRFEAFNRDMANERTTLGIGDQPVLIYVDDYGRARQARRHQGRTIGDPALDQEVADILRAAGWEVLPFGTKPDEEEEVIPVPGGVYLDSLGSEFARMTADLNAAPRRSARRGFASASTADLEALTTVTTATSAPPATPATPATEVLRPSDSDLIASDVRIAQLEAQNQALASQLARIEALLTAKVETVTVVQPPAGPAPSPSTVAGKKVKAATPPAPGEDPTRGTADAALGPDGDPKGALDDVPVVG